MSICPAAAWTSFTSSDSSPRNRCPGRRMMRIHESEGSRKLKGSSPQAFDQRPPPERIVLHEQQIAQRCQVVRQFTIGTGIHIADERGDRVFETAPVEIVEGPLLAPLDIFVARQVSYQGTFHFASATHDCFQ